MDLLRILACFMVVVIHTASMQFSVPVNSFSWAVFNFCDVAMRSSVPLFLMISGMMIMSREECHVKKLLFKSIPRLLVIFFLWSTLYAIDAIGPRFLIRNFNLKMFLQEIWNIAENATHLWYLPMCIGVYLVAPVLHAIRDKKKILMYIIAMFFVFAVISSTLAAFPETVFVAKVLAKFDNTFANYAGYFLMGYLLYYYKDQIKISNTVLVIALAGIIALTGLAVQLLSMAKGTAQTGLYNNHALPTFLEACIIFLLFLRLPSEGIGKKWKIEKWTNKAAKYTLFVYLFHPFVLKHLESNMHITTTSANALITMPAISVGVFLLCMGVAFLIDLIPGVRKILL